MMNKKKERQQMCGLERGRNRIFLLPEKCKGTHKPKKGKKNGRE
jgi:hypothetical protein